MAIKRTDTISVHLTEEDFIAFFKSYYQSLCFFANRFVRDTLTAEDIVGEVSIKVWEKRETLQHAAALKNYFYISIRRACLRFLDERNRKAIKAEDIPEEYNSQASVLENIIRAEVLQEVDAALLNLPPQCRKVFTKLYIEGKTTAEAAKELQLSVSTIKTQKERGLVILRKIISHPGNALLLAVLLAY